MADTMRDWVGAQVPADLYGWAVELRAQQQVSAPGVSAGRLTVEVGVNRVVFTIDTEAIVAPEWEQFPLSGLVPSCNCAEWDRWCVHAVAAALSLADAMVTDPDGVLQALAPPAPSSWIDAAFSSVAPADRARLYKTLAFCLHPDRRPASGPSAFAALQSAWERWGSAPT